MMPEMTGMDLHRELVRSTPDAASRVIFLTGGAFTTQAADFLDQVDNPRVEKPFDPRALRRLIANVVGERGKARSPSERAARP